MKLVRVLFVLLLAGLHPALGASPEQARPTGSDVCSTQPLSGILEEFRIRADKGETPSCPIVAKCPQGRSHVRGQSTFSDTGLPACTLPDAAAPVRCPAGSTIHIETKRRKDCPCAGTKSDEVVVGVSCQRYDL